jgi:chemotaxis protein histidine kinase CheA
MKFALKDVIPNPYRDLERNPVPEEKIERLLRSYEKLGFQENIPGRVINKNGRRLFQQSGGHSRIAALRRAHPSSQEFNFIVMDYDDAQMIAALGLENSEEFKWNVQIAIESVRAAVQAYADGIITPDKMPYAITSHHNNEVRIAPSFARSLATAPHTDVAAKFESGREGRSIKSGQTIPYGYTSGSLAEFLGMTRKDKERSRANGPLELILAALELEELGYLKDIKAAQLPADLKRKIDEAEFKRNQERLRKLESQRQEYQKRALEEAKQVTKRKAEEEEARRKTQEEHKKAQAAEKEAREAERQAKEEKDASSRREALKKRREAEEAYQRAEELKVLERRAAQARSDAEKLKKEQEQQEKKSAERIQKEKERKARIEAEDKRREELVEYAEELIGAGRRALATKYHPDHGGDHNKMSDINRVSKWLSALVKENGLYLDLE